MSWIEDLPYLSKKRAIVLIKAPQCQQRAHVHSPERSRPNGETKECQISERQIALATQASYHRQETRHTSENRSQERHSYAFTMSKQKKTAILSNDGKQHQIDRSANDRNRSPDERAQKSYFT